MRTRVNISFVFTLREANITARNSQLLYFVDLPQNQLLNPAFRSSQTVSMSVFRVSGAYMIPSNIIE